MVGRNPRQGPRPTWRMGPWFECLDARELLAAGGLGHSLGPYLAPAAIGPRISGTATTVDGHDAVNQYLSGILGRASIQSVQDQINQHSTSSRSLLMEKILKQPFVHAVLSDQDTYTLLNSQAMRQLIGFTQMGSTQQAGSTVQQYTLPEASISLITPDTYAVTVPASGKLSGFSATVPIASVRFLNNGFVTAAIPQSAIPPNAPQPQIVDITTGALQGVYEATGPLLVQALLTGIHRQTPNAPQTVPGLRLARFLTSNHVLPTTATHTFLHLFRVAVARNVFVPTSGQMTEIQAGLQQFLNAVNAMNQTGTFQPPVPPAPPAPAVGPLDGTLVISAGALRNLINVSPPLSGLQLFGINFPGRIDVGYAFARNGDFGLVLTARGPLKSAPAGFSSNNLVGGDVGIEVSNAQSLQDLNGTRVEEGVTVGAALMSSLTESNQGGIATFGATVGYGTGFEFGTGVSYTEVIPLGNVNALIPSAPYASQSRL